MQISQQIAEMLRDYEVTHFFFEPVILPESIKAMIDVGIVPVMTHGEGAAAYMADGYARITGRVGVCGAQAVGSTNLAAGIRDAYLGRSPVLALTGGPDASTRHRNLYQDVDDRGAYESVTKWNGQVDDYVRMPDLLRQAFRSATSGVPRPVHLEIAGDTQGDQEAKGEGFAEPRYSQIPSSRGFASPDDVEAAVTVLDGATRPLILAGNGVMRSRASEALLRFARSRSMPVVTSLNAKSSISHSDPLSFGTVGKYGANSANKALYEADVVLVVGSSLGSLTTNNWTIIAKSTKLVQIDVDGEEVGRIYPVEVPLIGDAEAVLGQLSESAAKPVAQAWLDHLNIRRAEEARELEVHELSSVVPMRPERLMKLVAENAKDDAIFVGDTGHIAHWTAQNLKISAGQTMVRAAGSLGWSLPASIGVKCAAPDQEVLCLTGDGGFYYHIEELETAKRYGLPVIVIVNNNGALNQEAFLWDTKDERQDRNWRFTDVDMAQVARGFGCFGVRVDSPDDFPAALEAARASGLPSVIDVRTAIDAVAARTWTPSSGS